MLYLSDTDLTSLPITATAVVENIEQAIQKSANGTVWAAPKSVITPPDGRYLMSTLAASEDPPLMAVKALVVNQQNPAQGLNAINASITLLNSQTGVTEAIMDGNWITAVRTAGASAVAAKYMALKNARSMAFIGCGVQAHSHLKLFSKLYPIEEIFVFSRGEMNRDNLCYTAQTMGITTHATKTAQQAIEHADIIISSIPLSFKDEPFLDAERLKPGAFVSSTDLALPWMPHSLSRFDLIVVDDLKQERAMVKPLVNPQLVAGDIKDLVTGKLERRENDQQIMAFMFRAVALGDLAIAALALQTAKEHKVGQKLED